MRPRATSIVATCSCCVCVQLDTEAACQLTELQQQLNVVLDDLSSAFAFR